MILIADAGASKTDWRLLDGQQVLQFRSGGFNLRTHKPDLLTETLPQELDKYKRQLSKVYYYGAGLTDRLSCADIERVLASCFDRPVTAGSDLLGAARSLFGHASGTVCILGTGSAACTYDGQTITRRIPSLGYVLGDEGSGVYLGRVLLQQFLRGLLPAHQEELFRKAFPEVTERDVLDQVYQQSGANRYLASFAPFVVDHQKDPYLYQVVYQGISAFFESYFGNPDALKDETFRFTGSIAYYLSNILRKFAMDHQLNIDMISQDPIAGLTLYHQEHG